MRASAGGRRKEEEGNPKEESDSLLPMLVLWNSGLLHKPAFPSVLERTPNSYGVLGFSLSMTMSLVGHVW